MIIRIRENQKNRMSGMYFWWLYVERDIKRWMEENEREKARRRTWIYEKNEDKSWKERIKGKKSKGKKSIKCVMLKGGGKAPFFR